MRMRWQGSIALMIAFLLLASVTGCNLPIESIFLNPVKKNITIQSVTVDPPSGSGSFTLSVTYLAEPDSAETITCRYLAPDKASIGIATFVVSASHAPSVSTQKKGFSVANAAGEILPGVYTAICEDVNRQSTQNATFVVTEKEEGDISIVDIQVIPGQAPNYTVQFAYIIRITDAVTFTCNYSAPDGATFGIGEYTDKLPTPDVTTKVMYFSVKTPQGNALPGVYTVTCQDTESRGSASTTFVIAEKPAPEVTSTPKVSLTSGTIQFIPTSEVHTPHLDEGGFRPVQFHKWCNLVVTMEPNGTFSGTCFSNQHPIVDLGLYGTYFQGATIRGTINGRIGTDGSITFHEELIEEYKLNDLVWWYVRKLAFEGTGAFVSTTQAKGAATFSAECSAAAKEGNYCGRLSIRNQFTGTIDWEFFAVP